MHLHSELLRSTLEHTASCRRGRDPQCASAEVFAIGRDLAFEPVHLGLALQQTVDQYEGVIDAMADEITSRACRTGDRRWDRCLHLLFEKSEWPLDIVHRAVTLHIHLIEQRP